MAVGDTLLFTLRDELGVTDVEITATEPETRRGRVVVSPRVEVIGQVGVGPPANLRFFRQEVDGRFEDVFTITEFPGREFTPDVEFNDQLDRGQFTIGVSIAGGQERPPSSVTPGNSLSSQIVTDEPEADPIPPPDGDDQFNIVLPPLPLIENDARILASLTIPQVSSITSAVSKTVPSVGQIRGAVDDAIAGPIDRLEETLTDEIRTEVSSIDFPESPNVPTVDQIVTDVETAVTDPLQRQLDTITEELTALDIPTADDISDSVDEVLGDLEDRVTQLGDNIDDEFDDIEQDVDQLTTDLSRQIETEIDDVESTVRTRLQTLQEEVAEDVGEITTSIDDLRGRLTEDIDQLGTDITSGLNEAQTAIESSVDDTVETAVSTLDSSIDTVQSELQSTIDGLQDEVTDLIDDLTEDVDSLIDDVTQVGEDLTGLIEDIPDIVEDGATRALEEIEPELNDSGLFTDPVGFAIGFVQEASDEIVDPEVSQDLQDTIDDL
jgi:gas vesicle protein